MLKSHATTTDTITPGSNSSGWARAIFATLTGALAVVPCVFVTRFDDVFYLPKIVLLWTLLALIGWLCALGAVFQQLSPGFSLRWVPSVDLAVAAFVGCNLLAFAWSGDRHQSLVGEHLQYQGLLTLVLYIAFFYVARGVVCRPGRVPWLFGAVMVGASIVSAYAIAQGLGLDPIWHGQLQSGRVFSTIGQANALAGYLVLAIPLALALAVFALRARRRSDIGIGTAGLAASVLMVVALFLTVSRGGFLGLVVVLAVLGAGWWAVIHPRREGDHPRSVVPIVATLVVLAGLGLAVSPAARSTVSGTWNRVLAIRDGSSTDSTSSHLQQWRVAVRIAGDHPLVGTGPETFPEVFPAYSHRVLTPAQASIFDRYRVESPHNVFLAYAAGSGIPALLAYLWLLGAVAVAAVRSLRERRASRPVRLALVAVLAAAAGHVTTDAFMSAEVTGSWIFYVLLGVGVALARSDRTARREPLPPDEVPVRDPQVATARATRVRRPVEPDPDLAQLVTPPGPGTADQPIR